ncbi:MAG: nucleotidyl transferase AbiEii/AbiGii toxin family protein [Candidatus Delongbacteria bacterium]|nr:nucleotidyl transferase AbiEii/AbiGii toxin family protein [Candidatus Delongbacteria bacterium]MDD4206184.1 nucleotidyl transferase AbiEii/AbiGii toxin family protein [Candidatus Delongbacteria bacterium]
MKGFDLNEEFRRDIFTQTGIQVGLPAEAVEKDWWVTFALNIVFSLEISDNIIFKGGTSLSKGWNLIERFSEDIDLALDRKLLGFGDSLSKNQIKILRKASFKFISGEFTEMIRSKIRQIGIPDFTVKAQEVPDSDTDPLNLELVYKSLFDKSDYLPSRVLIEIGARSLMEPTEIRQISSLIASVYSEKDFADKPIFIPTVLPKRTFLEKAFLLHEEFQKPEDKIRVNRLSRHLYDLDRLKDTVHGLAAIEDIELYEAIIKHREKFNNIRGIDYSTHYPDKIDFVPPQNVIKKWEADYIAMRESMIFGESKNFSDLISSIKELNNRFRNKSKSGENK